MNAFTIMLNMGSHIVDAYLLGLVVFITKQTNKHYYSNLKTLQKISPCGVSKQPTSDNLQQIHTNVHTPHSTGILIAVMKPYNHTAVRLHKPTQCSNKE